MKKLGVGLLVVLLLFSFAGSVDAKKHKYHSDRNYNDDRDRLSIDIEDGDVIVEYESSDFYDIIVITENYKLYVNDKKVDLNEDQEKLVKLFYKQVKKIKKYTFSIGWEGAKIGVEGAKLGVKAIGRVIKLLSPNYDSDDLERDMERDAEAIEERAEKLEQKAEYVEELLDELDELANEMREKIPELEKLEWL